MRWRGIWLTGVLVALGCQTILGIDAGALRPGAGGAPASGGAGGAGASNSSGGGGTSSMGGMGDGGAGNAAGFGGGGGMSGLPAADWTMSLDAAYYFEDPMLVGMAAIGPDLTVQGAVASTAMARQGALGASFTDGANALTSTNTVFNPLAGGSFTMGGWFQATQVSHREVVMGRFASGFGFRLERAVDDLASCVINGTDLFVAEAQGLFTDGVWHHVVCRYDAIAERLDILVDLVSGVPDSLSTYSNNGSFSLGSTVADDHYAGLMDEVFFTKEALSDEAIARIFACGIDGALCLCEVAAPNDYESCGRLSPGCVPLDSHACDALAP